MYKAALSQWHKGTGGGSGLEIEFEHWDDAKYEKYGIDKENYDHTDVTNRPLILFNIYTMSKQPFLTGIRLQDNAVDNILCAKYDPISIGTGEVGMENESVDDNNSVSVGSISSATHRKRKKDIVASAIGLQDVMKSITQLCDNNMSSPVTRNLEEKIIKGLKICP